jgi:serine/threonine protein kinase
MNTSPEMTPDRWEAVKKIFEAAVEEAPEARAAFIHNACAGDPELESGVAKLLAATEGAGSFLKTPAIRTSPSHDGSAFPPAPLEAGTIISGRFRIIRLIGQGGMGQVYEVFDTELKERIALKTIRPDLSADPHVLARFRREVQLTRHITHPNVCRTFDIDRDEFQVNGATCQVNFLTMELLEGETLASLLGRRGRLPVDEALPLIRQMVAALGAAHSAGVVHRDFKPANVPLVPSGNGFRVAVTDFGLARAVQREGQRSPENTLYFTTRSDGLLGTPAYMAPEQLARGEATPATDIYALGLVMFEMSTGRRPFADSSPFLEGVKRMKRGAAPSPKSLAPDLEPHWEAVIGKCLQVDPKARFDNVTQVLEPGWVSASVSEPAAQALQVTPASSSRPVAATRSSDTFLNWAVAIMILAAAGALLFAVWLVYHH